ncbi:MAG: type II toxin-antitoxin system RelE/ParE family toxin [Armatimonadetes bacterium]|nr:type II toxin-antitoxin system RelE/ParE family toxin [Armatimonadota bacterium]
MRIEWTEPAVLDLESIQEYIRKGSELYANIFIEKLINALDNLSNFPFMGHSVPEARRKNIREIIFHTYRIIYRVEKERILILAIIHCSRNLRRKKPKPWEIT